MAAVVWPEDRETVSLGGKANALASLNLSGLPIPPWFTVCSAPDEAELTAALQKLCPNGQRVAVRSSAQEEDGSQHSFAGQFESFLFVRPEDVSARIADVQQSGSGQRVQAYREESGTALDSAPPCVLIQRMVNADVSGIAFSANPVSGQRDEAVVTAIYGLGSGLVSGENEGDTFHIGRDNAITGREITGKTLAHRFDPHRRDGVKECPVEPERAALPALTDAEILQIADMARRVEQIFGVPQDIEWAIEAGKLYLLQARPITGLNTPPEPAGEYNLWDNSNIVESYSGVTTPLTFSFARQAYSAVYRQLFRTLGISPQVMIVNDAAFERMIGLIQGRVYYNLMSWYRLLSLLPGFGQNRRFMEQMMGVGEELPVEMLPAPPMGNQWRTKARQLVILCKLARSYRTFPRRKTQFYERLNSALNTSVAHLNTLRADELTAYYLDLERQLLQQWDAPLVNDLFTMIFCGVLRQLTAKWFDDANGGLANELLSGDNDFISAEPARLLRALAQTASETPELSALLQTAARTEIETQLPHFPRFESQVNAYLEKFGDRCMDELKLESLTLQDDPLPLFRAIGSLTASTARQSQVSPEQENAEARSIPDVNIGWLKRRVFRWVLKCARQCVRDRENLRFERTRVFGRVRRIFLAIGGQFHRQGILNAPRDIFNLETREIFGFIQGTAASASLQSLADVRKAEFETYRKGAPPPNRFETRGMVNPSQIVQRAEAKPDALDDEERKGMAAGRGRACGTVQVVMEPGSTEVQPGRILVAERTDPGWVILFASASGLIVERGSLLSHSAIVARELGLPVIVALPGATHWLQTGDRVEMDGGTGIVRRLECAETLP